MTLSEPRRSYTILPVDAEFVPGAADSPWAAIP